jgi:hypothetical protein
MKRRAFLLYSLGVTMLSFPMTGCIDRKPINALSKPQVLMRLCDAQTIYKIGEAYRTQVPAESDKEVLSDKLLQASSNNHAIDNTAVHAFLEKKIHQDFEAGRIVTVHGWIISETEARQCALFYLLSS